MQSNGPPRTTIWSSTELTLSQVAALLPAGVNYLSLSNRDVLRAAARASRSLGVHVFWDLDFPEEPSPSVLDEEQIECARAFEQDRRSLYARYQDLRVFVLERSKSEVFVRCSNTFDSGLRRALGDEVVHSRDDLAALSSDPTFWLWVKDLPAVAPAFDIDLRATLRQLWLDAFQLVVNQITRIVLGRAYRLMLRMEYTPQRVATKKIPSPKATDDDHLTALAA